MNENAAYVEDTLQCAEQESDNLDDNTPIDTSNCHERLAASNESGERSSAVWTYNTTLTLLRLYENKLEMLETPKRKTRIWVAISESLRNYNIMNPLNHPTFLLRFNSSFLEYSVHSCSQMSPDQVRWKINALTKKYKQCLHNRQFIKFKYFGEMDKIYAQYNVESETFNYSNDTHKQKSEVANRKYLKSNGESKAMIELKKVRLANRIESDRLQSRINLEKQWLEYLKREEQNSLTQDEILAKNIKIREEKFELKQQKLLMKESLELRLLELKENEQSEMLRIEREKCDLLFSIIANRNVV